MDAGDPTACPPTDQLGQSRLRRCDIGAVEFVPSADPLGDFIRGLYRHALGREPDPAEVAGWLGFLRADLTLDRVRIVTHAFFDGPEYRARPYTPEGHVTALYRAILGRDPDAPGFRGWTSLLAERRREMLRIFLESPEFQTVVPSCQDQAAVRALVIRLYEQALGRSPTVEEFNLWLFSFVTNCAVSFSVTTILTSPEYETRSLTLAERVTTFYRGLLARDPGPGEVAAWVDYLTPPFLEDEFIDSEEFAVRWKELRS